MMFVPHWEHNPPLPGNGDSFTVLYVDDVRTSLGAHASTACYGIALLFFYHLEEEWLRGEHCFR
jgi:hypothetical protein